MATTMKYYLTTQYGDPMNVLKMETKEKPVPGENQVLIKVKCVALNASDMEFCTGSPAYIRFFSPFKPARPVLGSDISGTIDSIGSNIKEFKVGDKVFGDVMSITYNFGGFAEYVLAEEKEILHIPDEMSFKEAAAIPQSSTVALQGLKRGAIGQGQKVLINGAGGGTGTFAIQLAKDMGAHVTAVDHTDKIDMLKQCGADECIDYTKENFYDEQYVGKFDLVLDLVARHSMSSVKSALSPTGSYILVGGHLSHIFSLLLFGKLITIGTKKSMTMLVHEQNKLDLSKIVELWTDGKVKPKIHDKVFTFETIPEAMDVLCQGKAMGNVLIEYNNSQ